MTQTPSQPVYCGRFAPSPTGPLHFGSLIAATGSYLEARSQNGDWHLRIDDIDPPREMTGAADKIQRTLDLYGLEWDGETDYQSQHSELYEHAFQRLIEHNRIFACGCSRKARTAAGTSRYPGTCRTGMQGNTLRSWRLLVEPTVVRFHDGLLGPFSRNMAHIGDIVVKRADGLFSYHLATAVDDANTRITHVVRGADLLEMTFPQRYIQRLLGMSSPHYLHLPIALGPDQAKLSKQNLAPALPESDAAIPATIYAALQFLGQNPPDELAMSPIPEIWHWAKQNWQLNRVPKIKQQPAFAAIIKKANNQPS